MFMKDRHIQPIMQGLVNEYKRIKSGADDPRNQLTEETEVLTIKRNAQQGNRK